jgi:hypothetical protein
MAVMESLQWGRMAHHFPTGYFGPKSPQSTTGGILVLCVSRSTRVSCHWLACLASQHRVGKKLVVSVFKQKICLKETAAQY